MSTQSFAFSGNFPPLAGVNPAAPGAAEDSPLGGGKPDAAVVQEMKNEIRILVQEIAELAQANVAAGEFYQNFLTRVVSAMAAVAGVVWIKREDGGLQREFQANYEAASVNATSEGRERHNRLLHKALAGGAALLTLPCAGAAGDETAGNPTDFLSILAPIKLEDEVLGLVEIFQRPGGGPTTQRGYVRFLSQMCDLAADYLKNQRLRYFQEQQETWKQLDQFVRAIHRSLDLRQTAYAVVNEGRRLIGCDRVTLAVCRGWRCEIMAVSGLDSIDRRATEAARLGKLAQVVIRAGEPYWHAAGAVECPPQVEAELQPYIDLAHAKMVAVIPLYAPRPERELNDSHRASPIGALIIEQLQDDRATQLIRSRGQQVADHTAGALAGSLEYNSLFLLPLWRALGSARAVVAARQLPKTLAVTAALLAVVAALFFIPADFEVAAKGKLQPAERREIFARVDGDVIQAPVVHGQKVKPGDVLAVLRSAPMEEELETLLGRQRTTQEQISGHNKSLLNNSRGSGPRLTPAEESRLASELLQFRQEAENIQRELELFRDKESRLTVVAHEPGQVVTWKVEESLLRRPVQRGQSLMTLANPDGPWELELYVPERRLKHLADAQQIGPAKQDRPPLEVTFALSSHPGAKFRGRVIEIEQTAEVRGDEGNTILVRVALNKEELPQLHDQTSVTAKLYCGRRSLGYTWFCDLIETVQGKILFWL